MLLRVRVCVCVCAAGESPLAFLRSLPQFPIMRHAIQNNPSMLPQLLQEVGRSNPQVSNGELLHGRGGEVGAIATTCLQNDVPSRDAATDHVPRRCCN